MGVGQEVGSVDFALIPGRTLKVSGTLVSASGMPLAGESVSLSQEVRGPTASAMFAGASVRTGADGTFTFLNVQAGEYRMTARVAARGDQPAQEAQQTLSIAGADIDGFMLVAGSGGTIRGQVVTDDGSPLPPNLERLTVRARSLTPGVRNVSVGAHDNGSVDKDGAFQVKGLFGPVVLSIGVLTGDWTLKAVEHEGRDLADDPIEVPHGETLSGVRVVLTSRPTHLRGALGDEKGQRAEGTIIIFPEESGRWRESSRSIRSTRPDQNGEFSFKGLPPGNYLITALDYVQDGQWNDPEFLETLKSRAERVAFGEGENKRVDLTLRK